jgi:hypothetical protein
VMLANGPLSLFLSRCGDDQPNVTDAEAGERAEPQRLVAPVFESCIRLRVRMMHGARSCTPGRS